MLSKSTCKKIDYITVETDTNFIYLIKKQTTIHSQHTTHVTCFECRHELKLKKWDPQQKNTHSQKYESGDIINEQRNSATSCEIRRKSW